MSILSKVLKKINANVFNNGMVTIILILLEKVIVNHSIRLLNQI